MTQTTIQRPNFADRVCEATSSHDIDRLVDCFTEDYSQRDPRPPRARLPRAGAGQAQLDTDLRGHP